MKVLLLQTDLGIQKGHMSSMHLERTLETQHAEPKGRRFFKIKLFELMSNMAS